ncbi:MAG TPA: NAD(P)-binding domain-containing protein [Solirubrobacteraceae bacterium]|nr:NAD(P)-binding domain-containing protein [Solirubrobacteraceae bacterium]
MRVAVLGTGVVGRTLASALLSNGHEVRLGSRTAGHPAAVAWAEQTGGPASEGTFADAAGFGELVINATAGAATLQALEMAGAEQLAGKVLLDVANPLDTTGGMPPTLTVCNDDSLGEQIQRALPDVRVVKTLNTVTAAVMVAPALVGGAHTVFVAGDNAAAKAQTAELLQQFGWPAGSILDLGDITAARGMEMYMALWLRLWGVAGTAVFNVEVRSGETAG